jgi:hypothetical protein
LPKNQLKSHTPFLNTVYFGPMSMKEKPSWPPLAIRGQSLSGNSGDGALAAWRRRNSVVLLLFCTIGALVAHGLQQRIKEGISDGRSLAPKDVPTINDSDEFVLWQDQ